MKKTNYLLLLLLLIVGGALPVVRGQAAENASVTSGVTRTVLPNGVTLLVRPSRHAPVAAVVTHVKAGYFDEPDQVAGMAHLFEHMFFKGSQKYPGPQAIAEAVRRLGGQSNAGTIYDSTVYYITVPREGVTAAMEIQADAIAHPLFDPAELKREAEVVIEESNRKYDNAPAFALEKMLALAFTRHRMRRWRIGSEEVLRIIRREDLLQFFESLYRPENLVVSVVGDVDVPAVIATATRTYGAIPRGTPRREPGPTEPPQTALRVGSLSGDIQQSVLTLGFHTPGVNHRDLPVLDVLATILAEGRGARAYKNIIRPGWAHSVNANQYSAGDVGVFSIQARLDTEKLESVEERIFAEIERLKRWPVRPEELMRARNQVETGFALGLEEALGQARTLARYEAQGSYKDLEIYLRRIRGMRPEEVRAAARHYLTLANVSIHRYLPKNASLPEPTPQAMAARLARVAVSASGGARGSELAARSEDGLILTPRPELRAPSRERSEPRFALPNGAQVLVRERHAVPTVAITVAFSGGKVRETPDRAGVTQLMLDSLAKGSGKRDAEALDEAIEQLGTSLETDVRDDYCMLSMRLLSQNTVPGIEILAEILRQPTFPEAEVSRVRDLQLATLRQSRDDANTYPITLLQRALYPEFAYGWPADGREESVRALTPTDVRAWYREVVRPGAMWIVVVGDVRPEALRDALGAAFGDWRPSVGAGDAPRSDADPRPPTANPIVPSSEPRAQSPEPNPEIVEQRARRQTAFALGFRTVPFGHADHPVLDVIQFLTSGLAGRFGVELRGKQSLAYVTGAGQMARGRGGIFLGYLAGQYDKEARAREGMLAEFARLTREPVGDEELARTKSAMAGAMKLRLQTNDVAAADLVRNVLLAGDPDFTARYLERIATVSPADIQRVAATYFGDRYAIGVLRGGPPGQEAPTAK